MAQRIASPSDIAADYDAIVFDQWGVLHNGSAPYPSAVTAIERLARQGHRMAVLSNSGKRAAPNAERIETFGFPRGCFETVMTSGEALWRDIQDNAIDACRFWVIERAAGDAADWAAGLEIELVPRPEQADAVLVMGLPDGSMLEDWQPHLEAAMAAGLPMYCSNPDKQSPRADGLVISPGALAFAYQDMGQPVRFYGKPHLPIFEALQRQMGVDRVLMVGDSLEHDIQGGSAAGWDTVLVQGGLYADAFAAGVSVGALAEDRSAPLPTYMIKDLS